MFKADRRKFPLILMFQYYTWFFTLHTGKMIHSPSYNANKSFTEDKFVI